MKRLLAHTRDRVDQLRADIRRRLAGTHLIEEMPHHPEHVRPLPDPVEREACGDIAEQLLDEGLADVAARAGWIR